MCRQYAKRPVTADMLSPAAPIRVGTISAEASTVPRKSLGWWAQRGRTVVAWRPFCPISDSNSTFCPSTSSR